eukprot:scaffold13503_cov32-Phaeocystis_antarctica.AAC.1
MFNKCSSPARPMSRHTTGEASEGAMAHHRRLQAEMVAHEAPRDAAGRLWKAREVHLRRRGLSMERGDSRARGAERSHRVRRCPPELLPHCPDDCDNARHRGGVAEVWSDSSSDITATLQADGAGNFSGTATMILLPRTFLSRNVRLVRAVISEVGDGKNLVDTDFQ